MDDQTKALFEASREGDLTAVVHALNNGADVNFINDDKNTPLVVAISGFGKENRRNIVRLLLDNGADPNFLGEENCGVVFQAVLAKDPIIMEMILSAGANPNFLMDAGESLYDWAEFDYRFDAFDLSLPYKPTDEDRLSEESWLAFLEKCADSKQVFQPEFLRKLREYGAKTSTEIKKHSNAIKIN